MSEPTQAPAPPMDQLTASPEFQAAVAAQVAKLLADLAPAPRVGESAALEGIVDRLAMGIANLSRQNAGHVYVAPAILKQRAEARDRMLDLMADAQQAGDVPTYQLTTKIQLMGEWGPEIVEPLWVDALHIERPTMIDWPGEPNDGMKPMNPIAEKIFAAYKDSIGSVERFEPKRHLGTTAKGRVVSGNGVPHKRQVSQAEREGGGPAAFRVHHRDQPGQLVTRNIMGTIMPGATVRVPG